MHKEIKNTVTEIDIIGGSPEKDEGVAIIPIPSDLEQPTFQHQYLGFPHCGWIYHTLSGEPAYIVTRYYKKGGDKVDLPWTYREYKNGKKDWDAKGIPAPRILYNLHHIHQYQDKTILICEGEKSADAAGEIFPDYVASTTPNGAGNGHQCDLSPLAGRDVVIWPDNDKPGRDHANQLGQLCLKAGVSSVRIVDIDDDFPDKWDLADEMPDGWTHEYLKTMIENAQPATDPLDGLVERAKENVSAAFAPEVIQALTELKEFDPGMFEEMRSRLKKAGVRVTELDKQIFGQYKASGMGSDDDGGQVDILLDIVKGKAKLFHSANETAYADIWIDGRRETWVIGSKGFRHWLLKEYFQLTEGAPNGESLKAALMTAEAMAHYNGEERQVFLRVARHEGKLYLDLCDKDWRVVEIDKDGWRVINDPPVRFRRTNGMLPLPDPVPGGSIHLLRPFLNLGHENDFILVGSWLVAVLRDTGPYPVLVIFGEQGSAKSSFSKLMKRLLDPNSAPLRTLRDERDMFIGANNGYTLVFDNISGMNAATSDTLCRLATGGAFVTRQLYTDQDEMMFDAMRPIVLNGIDDVVVRPDLSDRSISLMLEAIPQNKRKPEKELNAEFEEAHPLILGVLLDAVSAGLGRWESVKFDELPRMADFATWATACEEALWGRQGAFMEAYNENRARSVREVIEANPVASAVQIMMEDKDRWQGTANGLLSVLSGINVEQGNVAHRSWPQSPRDLSNHLRRQATYLRHAGVDIDIGNERSRDKQRERLITISKIAVKTPSVPSGLSFTDAADDTDEAA